MQAPVIPCWLFTYSNKLAFCIHPHSAHSCRPFLKELGVAVTWGSFSLLVTDNDPHICTSSPASCASSPWFTWINESTTNRRFFCPPLLQVSIFFFLNPSHIYIGTPLSPGSGQTKEAKLVEQVVVKSTNLIHWRLISSVCLMPNVRQL